MLQYAVRPRKRLVVRWQFQDVSEATSHPMSTRLAMKPTSSEAFVY